MGEGNAQQTAQLPSGRVWNMRRYLRIEVVKVVLDRERVSTIM